jgi:hypothetical protein
MSVKREFMYVSSMMGKLNVALHDYTHVPKGGGRIARYLCPLSKHDIRELKQMKHTIIIYVLSECVGTEIFTIMF